MPGAKKKKVIASKPVRMPDNDIDKTEADTHDSPGKGSSTAPTVRRSARLRQRTAEAGRKERESRSTCSAEPPENTKARPAGSRHGSAQPGALSKHGTQSSRVQRKEPRSCAPPSKSRLRNRKSDSKAVSSPVETFGAQKKPKSDARVGRFRKTKVNSNTPTHSIGHNNDIRTAESGSNSILGVVGQPPTKNPRSPAQPTYNGQALTKEALEAHTRINESTYANWGHHNTNEYASHPFDQNTAEEQTPDDSYVDPLEEFNRTWGYLPPFDEESERTIAFIINHPDLAWAMVRTQPGTPKFGPGLKDRNVALISNNNPDKCKADIESLDIQDFINERVNEEEGYELLWKLDQAKITATSSEALFQRTTMVSLIARHFLIYQRDGHENQLFDFSVEEPWTCPPMPSRALNGIKDSAALTQAFVAPENRFLTQPKPDLAVAFNQKAIMNDETWARLPLPIQSLANFEKVDPSNLNSFHFLVIEAKNPAIPIQDPKAFHQCSNCASQALFNYFEYFRDAGPTHEALFFEKVRFFSIVANRAGLLVRIHRAIEIPKDDIGRRVIPRDPSYLLEFEFQDFARIEGVENLIRSKVLDIMKRILKYAKVTLRPLIKDATSDIIKKLKTDIDFVESRNMPNVYRHGQPGIDTSRGSRPPTPASSINTAKMDSLGHGLQGVPLSSNGASLAADKDMGSRQSTPKPTKNRPRIPSKLGPRGKKRKASQTGAEDLISVDLEEPNISKRQRTEASCSVNSSQTSRMVSVVT